MIRILLVGGPALCRAGFRALLQTAEELEIAGETANGAEAVRLARKLKPDVILIDMALAEGSVLEATRQIHATQPQIRILILAMQANRQHLFESLKAGAAGFITKDLTFPELLQAIRTATTSGTYLSPSVSELVLDDYFRRAQTKDQASELEILSNREREILQFIAEGKSSAEIAAAIHISARTVETHRHNIMKKLDIHSIAGLTKFAVRHGLSSL